MCVIKLHVILKYIKISNLNILERLSKKFSNIGLLYKNPSSGIEFIHADRQTDSRLYEVIILFPNFSNAPKHGGVLQDL